MCLPATIPGCPDRCMRAAASLKQTHLDLCAWALERSKSWLACRRLKTLDASRAVVCILAFLEGQVRGSHCSSPKHMIHAYVWHNRGFTNWQHQPSASRISAICARGLPSPVFGPFQTCCDVRARDGRPNPARPWRRHACPTPPSAGAPFPERGTHPKKI